MFDISSFPQSFVFLSFPKGIRGFIVATNGNSKFINKSG